MEQKEKKRPDLVSVNVRLPLDLHALAVQAAKERDLSLAQYVRALLRRQFECVGTGVARGRSNEA